MDRNWEGRFVEGSSSWVFKRGSKATKELEDKGELMESRVLHVSSVYTFFPFHRASNDNVSEKKSASSVKFDEG